MALWKRCELVVPWNVPEDDIDRKLAFQPDLFFIASDETEEIVGSVMVGYEGHRGWINYLAVSPELQRSGLGRQLMKLAEARLRALGCPKINLQIRSTNSNVIAFYESLGFQREATLSLGKRL